MRLCCVVLNWKNAEGTIECVRSLMPVWEGDVSDIYVVDNASDDGSFDLFEKELAGCRLLKLPANLGYTGGNNFGMSMAFAEGADAVLVINNDILVKFPDGFVDCCDFCLKQNPLNLLAVRVVDRDSGVTAYPARVGWLIRNISKQIAGVVPFSDGMPCGCALVFGKDLYKRNGGFDERLFMYCDELDVSMRSAAVGGRVCFLPNEFCVIRDCSPLDRRPYVFYYQMRNLLLIMGEGGVRSPFLYLFAFVLGLRNALQSRRVGSLVATFAGLLSFFGRNYGRSDWIHRVR